MDVPANYPVTKLSERKLDYSVSLHAINTKSLPPLDDALAEKMEPGTTAEQFVQRVRERLERLTDAQFENAKRQAAIKYLLDKVDCELPAPVVEKEMTGICGTLFARIKSAELVTRNSQAPERAHWGSTSGSKGTGPR